MLTIETYIEVKGTDTHFGNYPGFRPIMASAGKDMLDAEREAKHVNEYYHSIGHEAFSIIGLQCQFCNGYGILRRVRKHKRTGRVLRSWKTPCLSCLGAEDMLPLARVD